MISSPVGFNNKSYNIFSESMKKDWNQKNLSPNENWTVTLNHGIFSQNQWIEILKLKPKEFTIDHQIKTLGYMLWRLHKKQVQNSICMSNKQIPKSKVIAST